MSHAKADRRCIQRERDIWTCPSGRNTNVEEKSLCAKMCSERQDSLGLPKEQDLGGGGDSGLGEMWGKSEVVEVGIHWQRDSTNERCHSTWAYLMKSKGDMIFYPIRIMAIFYSSHKPNLLASAWPWLFSGWGELVTLNYFYLTLLFTYILKKAGVTQATWNRFVI